MENQTPLPPKKIIETKDKTTLSTKLNNSTQKAFEAFQSTNYENGHQANRDDEKLIRRYKPLLDQRIDDGIPLSLFAMKSRMKEGDLPEEEHFILSLHEGEIPQGTAQEMYASNQKAFEIGGLTIRIRNNDFEIIDRFIFPEFRGQGIGSLLLKATETMAQKQATKTQSPQKIHAETAQLDVICWLWNQGYRPSTPNDQTQLEQILSGDSNLKIGENLYVFQKKTHTQECNTRNRKNAFRLRLEKTISPEIPTEISDQQATTQERLTQK